MTRKPSHRLKAALTLSMADIFFGAAGTLLCLIIITSTSEKRVVARFVDLVLECESSGADGWTVAPVSSPDQPAVAVPLADWFTALTSDRFLLRVGIATEPDELPCFQAFGQSAEAHNRVLASRGNTQAIVSSVLIPTPYAPGDGDP